MSPNERIEGIVIEVSERLALRLPVYVERMYGYQLWRLTMDRGALAAYDHISAWNDQRHRVIIRNDLEGPILRHILAHELTHALQAERALTLGAAPGDLGQSAPAPLRAHEIRGDDGLDGQWMWSLIEYEAWTTATQLSAELWGDERTIPEWRNAMVSR